MSRPRSNELARSGHVPLGEHGRRNKVDAPVPGDQDGLGPVPPANRPGARPETDQDRPVEAIRERLTAPSGSDADDSDGGAATVAGVLRIAQGVSDDERARVVDRLSGLDGRLAAFEVGRVELELSVKERGGRDQRTTLECWVAGLPRCVATSAERDLAAALAEVRDDLRRQLDDTLTRRAPATNRQLRRETHRSGPNH